MESYDFHALHTSTIQQQHPFQVSSSSITSSAVTTTSVSSGNGGGGGGGGGGGDTRGLGTGGRFPLKKVMSSSSSSSSCSCMTTFKKEGRVGGGGDDDDVEEDGRRDSVISGSLTASVRNTSSEVNFSTPSVSDRNNSNKSAIMSGLSLSLSSSPPNINTTHHHQHLTTTVTTSSDSSSSSSSPPLPPLLVVAGPSGVGKGTLILRLRSAFPEVFGFSVSHTSRAPRPGEENGKHYFFEKKEIILDDVRKGLFLEHAEVHGNIYGTSMIAVENVRRKGLICILEIDVQGVAQVKASALGNEAFFLFVKPPSIDELEKRLRGRGTETDDKILKRLSVARKEVEVSDALRFDFVLVNDNLDDAYMRLMNQVLEFYPSLKQHHQHQHQ